MFTVKRKDQKSRRKRRPSRYAREAARESDLRVAEMIATYYNSIDVEESNLSRELDGLVSQIGGEFWLDLFGSPEASSPAAAAELRRELPRFRSMIRWICSRKKPSPTSYAKFVPLEYEEHFEAQNIPEERRDILRKEIAEGRMPMTPEDIESLNYLQAHGRDHFKVELRLWGGRIKESKSYPEHLVDLFCRFLLDTCAGKDPDDLPVRFCLRCGRLFAVRPNRDYCSLECRYKKFWTKEKRADDMYVRRLEDYSEDDLRKKLAQPDVKKRLDWIEFMWPSDSAIVALIGRIRHRASVTRPLGKGSRSKSFARDEQGVTLPGGEGDKTNNVKR